MFDLTSWENTMSAVATSVTSKLAGFETNILALVQSHKTLSQTVTSQTSLIASLTAQKDAAEAALKAAEDKIDSLMTAAAAVMAPATPPPTTAAALAPAVVVAAATPA